MSGHDIYGRVKRIEQGRGIVAIYVYGEGGQ